jgi:hypothetical protein
MRNTCSLLYFHLCPARLCNIISNYLINSAIFGKKLLIIKCVLIFSATFIRNISHSQKNSATYYQKRTYANYPSFLSNFNQIWIFTDFFGEYTIIKFNEHPSSGSRVVPCGRTDRQTDCFTQFREPSVCKVPWPANYVLGLTQLFVCVTTTGNIRQRLKKPSGRSYSWNSLTRQGTSTICLERLFSLDSLNKKVKSLHFLDTSHTTFPMTHIHTNESMHLQQQSCDNVTSHNSSDT